MFLVRPVAQLVPEARRLWGCIVVRRRGRPSLQDPPDTEPDRYVGALEEFAGCVVAGAEGAMPFRLRVQQSVPPAPGLGFQGQP